MVGPNWLLMKTSPCAVREFVESCGFNLAFNTTIDTLTFKDFPSAPPGGTLSCELWLVSLNRDSSLHSQYGGFGWSSVNMGPPASVLHRARIAKHERFS